MVAHKRREDCEYCDEHLAWEERLKILEYIPPLLGWKNITKGVFLVLGVILTIFFGIVLNGRSEQSGRQNEFENRLNQQQERLTKQVEVIILSVGEIKTNVAVMKNTYEMSLKKVDSETENNRLAIKELQQKSK